MSHTASPEESPHDKIISLVTTKRLALDANQLLCSIMEKWGGPAQFAHDLYTEFQSARPGSLIRQNILETIQKLVVNNTNHNITQVVNPTDLDDDEIDEQLAGFAKRAADFINETQEPTAPASTSYCAPWLEDDEPPPL